MAEFPENQAGGPTVAAEAPGASATLPPNQPQPSDIKLTAILAKQDAGEKLSAADRGYLGAVKRKEKRTAPVAEPDDNPLFQETAPLPGMADNPLFEARPENSGIHGFVAGPPVDSETIRKTANAILDSLDTVTKLYIGNEAKQAGANAATIDQYKSAVAIQPENRELIVANSEPVILTLCEFFNTTPDKLAGVLKNCGFVGGLVAHSLAVYAVAKSIRESRNERKGNP